MPASLKTKVTVRVEAQESETGIAVGGASASHLRHLCEHVAEYDAGTAASQADVVWSGSGSVASGSPATVDLRGSLASVLTGDATNFVEVVGFMIRNKSTTTAQYLEIGGGSNAFSSWAGGPGDAVRVGPGGALYISSPIDGYATTAGTADVLKIEAATGTIAYDIVIVGRSA